MSGAGPTLLAVTPAPVADAVASAVAAAYEAEGIAAAAVHVAGVDDARSEARVSVELVCAACGAALPALSQRSSCACGGLLDVVQHPRETGAALARPLRPQAPGRRPRRALGSGVWRFRELLLPGRGAVITHPEGRTPLVRREAIARFAGHADLALKHEGHNPTGSFKDRGMTVAVSHALRSGATAVACASTGNTSASMAAYAAQAGLRALVFVPVGRVAAGKLAQALAYGARTLLVKADFDGCLALVREAHERLGIALLNSINPWRIEGQKTIVFDLLQQRAWDPPDWIVVPAGNLGNTAAFGKALAEARALGLIRRVPRLAAVQARGASPFYRSFRRRLREALPGPGGDRRHRDPHRRPGEPRPSGARDPRHARRRDRRERPRDPRGEGRRRRRRRGLRAGLGRVGGRRPAPRGRGRDPKGPVRGRGADRPPAQGPRGGDGVPLAARGPPQPARHDRAAAGRDVEQLLRHAEGLGGASALAGGLGVAEPPCPARGCGSFFRSLRRSPAASG